MLRTQAAKAPAEPIAAPDGQPAGKTDTFGNPVEAKTPAMGGEENAKPVAPAAEKPEDSGTFGGGDAAKPADKDAAPAARGAGEAGCSRKERSTDQEEHPRGVDPRGPGRHREISRRAGNDAADWQRIRRRKSPRRRDAPGRQRSARRRSVRRRRGTKRRRRRKRAKPKSRPRPRPRMISLAEATTRKRPLRPKSPPKRRTVRSRKNRPIRSPSDRCGPHPRPLPTNLRSVPGEGSNRVGVVQASVRQ